jgi:DNA-directed RNA polymerase specialized sigma24 family protein
MMKTQTLQPRTILNQDDEMSARLGSHLMPTAHESALTDLRAYLRDLPDLHRNAFVLRRFDRLEYGDIAAQLQISEQAARRIVYDVLRELRVLYATEGGAR